MRTGFFSAGVIAGIVWMGVTPVEAAPSIPGSGSTNIHVVQVENVGYRRRYYRRYGYAVPYAYYPPAYGYYVPPAYAYPPPGLYPPPVGDYAGAPPPEGDYSDAPDGDYADGAPPDGDYPDAPPPQGY